MSVVKEMLFNGKAAVGMHTEHVGSTNTVAWTDQHVNSECSLLYKKILQTGR